MGNVCTQWRVFLAFHRLFRAIRSDGDLCSAVHSTYTLLHPFVSERGPELWVLVWSCSALQAGSGESCDLAIRTPQVGAASRLRTSRRMWVGFRRASLDAPSSLE